MQPRELAPSPLSPPPPGPAPGDVASLTPTTLKEASLSNDYATMVRCRARGTLVGRNGEPGIAS